jgi:oligoribonuclease
MKSCSKWRPYSGSSCEYLTPPLSRYKTVMPEEFAPLVWIAIETSGPDPERDSIVGIASLVTTAQLQVVARGPALDHQGGEPREASDMNSQTLAFLAEHCEAGASPLCGSRMGLTRRFLGRQMAEVDAFLHYRTIDVLTIQELARRWFPDRPAPSEPSSASASASASVRASLEALVEYRAQLFVPSDSSSASGAKP